MDERRTPHPDLPLHRLQVPLPHLLPFAIGSFDTIGPLSRAGFPHRHSFFEIVHVTGGAGAHVQDLVHRPLRPPQLCVIAPGQVHYWADADGLAGQVVLFNEDFLLSHPQDLAALRELAARPTLRLGEQAGPIGALPADMEHEYRACPAGYAGVLRAGLHILIVRALRARAPGEGGAAPGRAAELAAGSPWPATAPAPARRPASPPPATTVTRRRSSRPRAPTSSPTPRCGPR